MGTGQPTGGRQATGGASTGVAETGGNTTSGGASAGAAATGGRTTSGGGANGGRSATGGSAAGGATPGGTSAAGGATPGGTSAAGGAAPGGTSAAGGAAPGGASAAGGAVSSTGCGKTTHPATATGLTISVSGSNRTYNLRIPDNYDANHAYRLIVAFHWLNGTANDVTNGNNWATGKPYYGLWDLAGGSTIFVAPQGIGNGWSNGSGSDITFTKALITQLESQLCIDTSRIFAEGFSMGGSMSYAVACAMSDIVRGVAVHSGGPMSGCDKTNRKPIPYFMTHGTKDGTCTYPTYGVPQLQDYASMDKCTNPNPSLAAASFATALGTPTDTSGKNPVCTDFTGCLTADPVRSCIFVGDHTPSPGGTSTSWVPGETWKFFTQF